MESLTDDELAYHQRALAQLRAAQTVWESWASHLAQKYQLRATDSISESGLIERSPSEDAPEA